MKKLYYRLLVITFSILIFSCSKDDELKNTSRITFEDAKISQSSPFDIRILHGDEIVFSLFNATADALEIRNKSNDQVSVTIIPKGDNKGSFALSSKEGNDQNVSFDVFFNGKSLGRVNIYIEVPYKLLQDGKEIIGSYPFDYVVGQEPKEFEIVTNTNEEIENFDIKNIVVLENGKEDWDFKIRLGNKFKISYEPLEPVSKNTRPGIFYYSDKYKKRILVKELLLTSEVQECYTIVVSGGSANGYKRFRVVNNKPIERVNGTGVYEDFIYKDDIINQVLNQQSRDVRAEYIHENNKIAYSVRTYDTDLKFVYDNNNNLLSRLYGTYKRETATFSKFFSLDYGDYKNGLPEKTFKVLHDGPNRTPSNIYYYKNVYDNQRRLMRDSISYDNAKFYLHAEYEYHETETFMETFEEENGEYMIAKPIIKLYNRYDTENGITTLLETIAYDNLEKDEKGRLKKAYVVYPDFASGSSRAVEVKKVQLFYLKCNGREED